MTNLYSDRSLVGSRCRLHSTELDELGKFSTPVPNWNVGDTFTTSDDQQYRILKIARVGDEDNAVINSMWMVEPVEG